MGQDTLMLIVFGVILIVAGIYYLYSKSTGNTRTHTSKHSAGNQETEENKNNGVKRVEKAVEQRDMSEFIKFDKIANDMIYQNKGEKYSMVIQCKGINYNLLSEIEQMAIEEGFIMFLNTLKFPIQLYVQTKSIDLTENVKEYKERVKMFVDKQNKVTAKYNEVEEDIDATQEEVDYMKKEKLKYTNIAEYVSDITRYVERMALNKHMLQRNFYIIVSYYKNELATTEKFTSDEYEDLCYRELFTRAQGIIASLVACSISCSILKSNDLAQLIYASLNKDDSQIMSIKEALESGIFRLYTSSEDVLKKKREMIDQELTQRSLVRVEEAVKKAMEKGLLLTKEEQEEEVKKEIDKRALRVIEKSQVDEDTKRVLKSVIKEERRERLEELNNKKAEYEKEMQQSEELTETDRDNDANIEIQKEDTNMNDEKNDGIVEKKETDNILVQEDDDIIITNEDIGGNEEDESDK